LLKPSRATAPCASQRPHFLRVCFIRPTAIRSSS
jgi:hypothetical protein